VGGAGVVGVNCVKFKVPNISSMSTILIFFGSSIPSFMHNLPSCMQSMLEYLYNYAIMHAQLALVQYMHAQYAIVHAQLDLPLRSMRTRYAIMHAQYTIHVAPPPLPRETLNFEPSESTC